MEISSASRVPPLATLTAGSPAARVAEGDAPGDGRSCRPAADSTADADTDSATYSGAHSVANSAARVWLQPRGESGYDLGRRSVDG